MRSYDPQTYAQLSLASLLRRQNLRLCLCSTVSEFARLYSCKTMHWPRNAQCAKSVWGIARRVYPFGVIRCELSELVLLNNPGVIQRLVEEKPSTYGTQRDC